MKTRELHFGRNKKGGRSSHLFRVRQVLPGREIAMEGSPPPSLLSTVRKPSWFYMILRQMARQIAVPKEIGGTVQLLEHLEDLFGVRVSKPMPLSVKDTQKYSFTSGTPGCRGSAPFRISASMFTRV